MHAGVELIRRGLSDDVGLEFCTHPDGTVEALWGVRRQVMTVEREDYIPPETPTENVIALFEAYKECGRY